MNFAIPPKILEYADYLLPFELVYRDIHNLDITNEKEKISKTRIKDCAFPSFKSYNGNGAPLNLTSEEFAALLPLLTKVFISKKCEISYLILINLLK